MSNPPFSDCNKEYNLSIEEASTTFGKKYKLVEDLKFCDKCDKDFKFCINCGYLINEKSIKCQICLAPQITSSETEKSNIPMENEKANKNIDLPTPTNIKGEHNPKQEETVSAIINRPPKPSQNHELE